MSFSAHPVRLCVVFVLTSLCLASTAPAQEAARTISNTVPLAQNGTVSIDNHEGSITVSSWDQDRVQYEARIMPTDEDPKAEKTSIEIDQQSDRLVLSTEHAEGDDESKVFGFSFESGWQWGGIDIPPVHYTLKVPSSAQLTIDDHESTIDVAGLQAPLVIDTHEGPLSVNDHSGDVTIDTHESHTEIRSVSGRLKIDTHDGPVTVVDQLGPVTLSTHDGRVDLRSVQGRVSIDAHDSEITVEDLRGGFGLDTHDAEVTVGLAELSENIRIDTHEAIVSLNLPTGKGFDLNTDFDDDVTLDSDPNLSSIRQGDDDEVNYRGPVRGGGPEIYLEADDGRFTLRSQ